MLIKISLPCSCHNTAMSLYNIKIAMELSIVLNFLQVMSRAEGDVSKQSKQPCILPSLMKLPWT